MGFEQLLTGSRWTILESLAKQPRSTSELSEELQTSQANISQQLKQLEIAGLVARRRAPNKKRVHYVYEIQQQHTYLASIAPGRAKKQSIQNEPKQQLIFSLLAHKHAISLITFILCLPNYFEKSMAIGVLERAHPELFILTEHVDEFRTNSNIELETIQGKKTVAIWSHSEKEVHEGFARKDNYFYESLKETSIVYDPSNTLQKLKKQAEEHNNE